MPCICNFVAKYLMQLVFLTPYNQKTQLIYSNYCLFAKQMGMTTDYENIEL